jgi:protein-arginine kinase activator protein McsA
VEPAKGPAKTPAKPQTPLEALQSKLEKAVVEERYEDAAQLRDEINRIQKHTDN